MTLSEPNRTRMQRWAAILAMAAAYIHCVAISWGKWGDLLIDAPWDLDDARTLVQPGVRLYVDFTYPYGPLIPYFNALLFRHFGINSWVLFASGLCAAALMTCLVYRTARLFIGRFGAATAAVAFLYICGFAKLSPNGGFNWAMSYRSSAQDGALLAMASVFFLLRHTRKQKPLDFWLSVLFLALAGLTKVESLTAAAAPHLVFIVFAFWSRRVVWKLHASGYIVAVAMVLGVFGYFYAIMGRALFDDNLFQLAFHPIYKRFALKTMGLDDIGFSLTQIAFSLLYLAAVCAPPFVLDRFFKQKTDANGRSERTVLNIVAGVCAALLMLSESLESTFRFVPVLAAGILMRLVWTSFKDSTHRPAVAPLAILWSFVLGSLTRVLFKTVSYHYGFYLLPPALVALAVFFFDTLPSVWPERPRLKTFCSGAGIGLFLGLIVHHVQYSIPAYAERNTEIRTPTGSLLIADGQVMDFEGKKVFVPTGKYYQELVQFLSALPRDSRVLIAPHGEAGLTYFCSLKNVYKDYITCVPTLKGRYDDDDFLRVVQAQPPDYIIRIALDLSEYYSQPFGFGYSQKTWAWLAPQYEVIKVYEPRYIVVMKKKAMNAAIK